RSSVITNFQFVPADGRHLSLALTWRDLIKTLAQGRRTTVIFLHKKSSGFDSLLESLVTTLTRCSPLILCILLGGTPPTLPTIPPDHRGRGATHRPSPPFLLTNLSPERVAHHGI